ncbi:MAG: hypothetical protein NZ522_09205, partial [Chitinophagales bacterium]|nr:hypothetical protein [Chitinophagales bacterium]
NNLKILSSFHIHSIEQPVKPGQYDLMREVCASGIIPVALDEELIGIHDTARKSEVLKYLKPSYIVLKPSLLGGFMSCDEWIALAEKFGIGWWATSALESNIGLSAIAQWVACKNISIPQGLGTGGLYENNVPAETFIKDGALWFKKDKVD